MDGLKRMGARLVELIYPRTAVCMGCGSAVGFAQPWLCPDCRTARVKGWMGAFEDLQLDGSAAAFQYKGPASGMVRRMKYGSVKGLAELMEDDMLRAYARIQSTGAELVTAVPMHPKRLRERGFNHAEVLARAVAAQLELPYENVIVRTRNTVQQARLEGEERLNNLKDAFEADGSAHNRRILLVDDVYTTGETARECAIALRAAGARSVSFLSYAKGGK